MTVVEAESHPIRRVGVIGGGQLAWMMAGAAPALQVDLVIQTPQASDPAVPLAVDTVLAAIADYNATAQLAQRCQVITFENEFVNLEALARLEASGVCFRPGIASLQPLLDKYHQRDYLRSLGLPTPEFIALDSEIPAASAEKFGFPCVLKTRRHGYDGQGTYIVRDAATLADLRQRLAQQPLLLEAFVPFQRELAVIAARSVSGAIAVYPIVETQQEEQVCRRVIAPTPLAPKLVQQIEAIARTLLEQLQVVGLFGIELFLTEDQQVFVNEIAPRTHNSGHFTLDACVTSQFEQHLRAVCGLPLGDPRLTCQAAVMVNLLGYETAESDYQDKREQLTQIPHAHLYWYGKSESRPGRKLGHVTVLLPAGIETDLQTWATATAQTVEGLWYPT